MLHAQWLHMKWTANNNGAAKTLCMERGLWELLFVGIVFLCFSLVTANLIAISKKFVVKYLTIKIERCDNIFVSDYYFQHLLQVFFQHHYFFDLIKTKNFFSICCHGFWLFFAVFANENKFTAMYQYVTCDDAVIFFS